MEQKNWHQWSSEALLERFGVTREQGLTDEEALKRREESGWNELQEGERISPILLFLNQFKDFMMLVLMGATLISGFLGEYLDAITIIAIIILNGVLGFIQEFRAERSLRALKELSAPHANVLRQGIVKNIPARELVPGDIVLMESGDRIPADIRWLSTNSLDVEESALTGESHPVGKHAGVLSESDVPLGDQKNIGFM
ncbi:MAG: HAD-IC family P-type ATPase, partial [Paenibacillaceae bacterium]|nr:HAD-IC family P-type ATPase [Paenibacillaceae bacterium]